MRNIMGFGEQKNETECSLVWQASLKVVKKSYPELSPRQAEYYLYGIMCLPPIGTEEDYLS